MRYWENECEYIGFDGKPITRTKEKYPYSYEPYFIWKKDNFKNGNNQTVYSDRLFQWDSKKFNECSEKVWKNSGQYFDNRNPSDIEKFLSLYYGEDIELTGIMQCCNLSNGYPIWIFLFNDKEKQS
jgi:hypothetical protein